MPDSKTLILQELKVRMLARSADLAQKLGISRQAIHRLLMGLINKALLKQGSSRATTFYVDEFI